MQRRNDRLFRRAADVLRREGIVPFCARAARRLRESVIETNAADWYCIDLSKLRAEPHCPPDVEIDFNATDEALMWLRAIRTEFNWVGNETELQVARTAGHVIGLGRVSGEKAGFIKIGVSSVYVTDYSRCVRVPANSAFLTMNSFIRRAAGGIWRP